METKAGLVIIGAGIVGCSTANFLAQLGYADVLVIDKGDLFENDGSTSHSPGGVNPLSNNLTMARMAGETIDEVGIGGHLFGTAHTLERFESGFYEPGFSDRQGYDSWVESGSLDAAQRATGIYQDLLAGYEAPQMDVAVKEESDDFVARRKVELRGVNLYE